ncbi:hypothetical protein PC123_g25552 [Phytophthora cactorum]|nr:hypothetical protein PC123_g25552 [Phytophthora cactorum]
MCHAETCSCEAIPDVELALQFYINQQLMNLTAQLLEVVGVPTQNYRHGDHLGGLHRTRRVLSK